MAVYSLKQIADECGITKSQAEYAIRQLQIEPVIKIGRTRGYNEYTLYRVRTHKVSVDKPNAEPTVDDGQRGSGGQQDN